MGDGKKQAVVCDGAARERVMVRDGPVNTTQGNKATISRRSSRSLFYTRRSIKPAVLQQEPSSSPTPAVGNI